MKCFLARFSIRPTSTVFLFVEALCVEAAEIPSSEFVLDYVAAASKTVNAALVVAAAIVVSVAEDESMEHGSTSNQPRYQWWVPARPKAGVVAFWQVHWSHSAC